MAEIRLNGDSVETVYDLLGRKENDITYALGWGLSQSDELLARFLELCGASADATPAADIDLQRHGETSDQAGITDIEIDTPRARVIVEAKRGWNLPEVAQLRKYAPRLADAGEKDARIVVLTQWGEQEYVRSRLGSEVDGYAIATVGLSDVALAAQAAARRERRPATRQLLGELARYLLNVAELRNPHDNRVYVVSLSENMSEAAGLSYIDVVEKLGVYWYAAGSGGWPKTPFNYMGYRYRGRLQSIRRVEDAQIVENIADAVDEVKKSATWGPAFVLRLGPPIPFPGVIRTGRQIVRSARRVVDLDLLISSPTISEAYARTVERHRVTAGAAVG